MLVFPGTAKGGHLDSTTIRRNALYPALRRAGIERENRTFHSLRHTFARRALEGGVSIAWVKEQLGHSSITLTVDRYGHWETEARRWESRSRRRRSRADLYSHTYAHPSRAPVRTP